MWYEMRKGETALKEQCQYLVWQPNETLYRPKKDPRDISVLDPACGSGHFLLYCFDVLETIYEEAYEDPDLGTALKKTYTTLAELKQNVPGLILRHNLHGIDIDLRATQIAAIALWLCAQRAYSEMSLVSRQLSVATDKGPRTTDERPKIAKSNIVCAEPMPGEQGLLQEFIVEL